MKRFFLGMVIASMTSTAFAAKLECEISQANTDKKFFSAQISSSNNHGSINLGKIEDWQIGATSDGNVVGIVTASVLNPLSDSGLQPITTIQSQTEFNTVNDLVVLQDGSIVDITCSIK